MLRKKERLSREAFNRFFSMGKRYQSPSLTLVHGPHAEFHGSVVVSKKVEKSAVKRNKLRRRIYDILRRRARAQLRGVFIFLAKPKAKDQSYQALKEEVEELIGRT